MSASGTARVDLVVTSGQFELDGGVWDVDNNVWIIGDDSACLVIDPAHDAEAILAAVGDRQVTAIVCTHAHNDHVNAAPAVADRTGAPIVVHPDDRVLWDLTIADRTPDGWLADGQTIAVGDVELTVLHTPGHAPGACCLYSQRLGELFSGDTLFRGGPGATGRSYSDRATIVASIRDRLLGLPHATVVRPGHGDCTTIEQELGCLDGEDTD